MILITHNDQDSAPARWLADHLLQAGYDVELAHPVNRDQQIRTAAVVVVVLTPITGESAGVRADVQQAERHGHRLLPVLMQGETIPAIFKAESIIDLRTDPQAGVAHLVTLLDRQQDVLAEGVPPVPSGILILLGLVMVLGIVLGAVLLAGLPAVAAVVLILVGIVMVGGISLSFKARGTP
jgi:hypothetical protein